MKIRFGGGWDACIGLGSPIGAQVAAALGASPSRQAKKTVLGMDALLSKKQGQRQDYNNDIPRPVR
jgi:hypothetical protein